MKSLPLSDQERATLLAQTYGWPQYPVRFFFDDHGQLRRLNLQSAQLSAVPAEIGQFSQLEYLDLSHNHLTRLPQEMSQWSQLAVLWLDYNRLTTLPSQIGHLTHLRSLSLGHNRLASLPPEIGQLRSLNDLYLYHNRLTTLPAEIGQLSNLEHLALGKNPLVTLPPEIRQLIHLWTFLLDEHLSVTFAGELDQLLMTVDNQDGSEDQTQHPRPVRSLTERVLVAYSHFSLDAVEYPSETLAQLNGAPIPSWMLAWPRHAISVASEGNDHIASVRLEMWKHEPSLPSDIWDDSCSLSVHVEAPTVAVWDGYGNRSSRNTLLVGEPGIYHVRCLRHARPAIPRALERAREEGSRFDEEGTNPDHMECYLFQFWSPPKTPQEIS